MKMNKKIIISSLVLVFSIVCYMFFKQQKNLQKIELNKNNLVLNSKILTNAEFTQNFKGLNYFQNRDTRNKYKALLLDIENKGDKEYILYKNGIDLNLIRPEKIKKNLKVSDTIVPMLASGLISTSFIFYFGFAYVPSTIAAIAGGTTASSLFNVNQNNSNLKNNISNKSFDLLHGILVPAQEKVRTVLFLKKEDIRDNFEIKLINKTDNISESFRVMM